jgi:hypothetical protein
VGHGAPEERNCIDVGAHAGDVTREIVRCGVRREYEGEEQPKMLHVLLVPYE